MATKLEKSIKREIELDGQAYMVTISPEGVKLTQKGYRKGREMTWRRLWEGGSEEGGAGGGGASGGARGSTSGSGGQGGALGGESGMGGQAAGRSEH